MDVVEGCRDGSVSVVVGKPVGEVGVDVEVDVVDDPFLGLPAEDRDDVVVVVARGIADDNGNDNLDADVGVVDGVVEVVVVVVVVESALSAVGTSASEDSELLLLLLLS